MAELQRYPHQVSGKAVILASAAGLAIGGPLFALMGFCFLGTAGLFLVASPLLLLFSPLLFGAVLVFITALTGFGFATFMAIAGLSSLLWGFRSLRGGPRTVEVDTGSFADILMKPGEEKEKEVGDWAGYLQNNPQENLNMPNRG